jgi:uncharacterized protein YaaW (UPF0174 family)
MSEICLREPDDDLIPLLRKCNNDDLEPLVSYITQKGWISSELDLTDVFKMHNPDHKKYADEIAAEIQKYGGNTIPTVIGRGGKGVLYKEVVCDVGKRLKANFNKKRETEFIEQQIVLKVLETAWDKMDDDKKREFLDGLGDTYKSLPIPKNFPVPLLQAAIKLGGFAPYKITLIVANAIARAILGRGLPFAVNTALTRYMAVFAGPIGWAVTAIWTIFDIASPAYRVTIPCVLHIAMLRQKYILEEQGVNLFGGLPDGIANKIPESVISA